MRSEFRFKKRPRKTSPKGYVYYVMFASMPGKWISTGTHDYTKAVQWASRYDPPAATEMSDITFREYTEDFFVRGKCPYLKRQESHGKHFGDMHIHTIRRILERYLWKEFGKKRLSMITRRDIDQWLVHLDCAFETKNKYLATLRNALDQAAYDEIIPVNPAKEVPFFKGKNRDRGRWSKEELALFFPDDIDAMSAVWGSLSWATYFYILASTGLRPSEVSALYWEDWAKDLHGLVVGHAYENLTGKRKGTKTGVVKPAILTERGETLLSLMEMQRDDEPRIFSVNGGRVRLATIAKHLRGVCSRLKIDQAGRTPYTFRHTFNTLTVRNLPREIVQTLMGHATDAMTRRYDHPTDDERLQDVQRGNVRDYLSELF